MMILCVIFVNLAIAFASPILLPRPGSGRIVGGSDVSIAHVPYQVSVRSSGSHICGGTILSERVVLTAAHCIIISSEKPNPYSIQYGVTKIGGDHNVIEAERVLRHEKYNGDNIDYDVALIFLTDPIEFGITAQAVRLPSEAPAAYTECLSTGWGVLMDGSSELSKTLQAVTLEIVDHDKCASQYQPYPITERMFCAGVDAGGKDACQGDSGGPLVISNEIIGIVSWGAGCARPQYPGVFTNVYSLHKWIVDHTN